MKFYLEQIESVFKHINSSEQGLSTAEAERRLAENGKNKLEEGKKKTTIQRVLEQLSDPMIIILLFAAAISGVLAVVENESFTDVIIILAVVALVIALIPKRKDGK